MNNNECQNPECPNGNMISTMTFRMTGYCCNNCRKAVEQESTPDPKPPVKKRSPRKRATKKASAS